MHKLDFFFDIDGTLLPFGKEIPESAKNKLLELKESGHELFLCSGRSIAEIAPALFTLPFSGGVYSAGGTVIYNGKRVYERFMNERERAVALSLPSKYGLLPLIQTEVGTFYQRRTGEVFEGLIMKYIGRMLEIPNLVCEEELSPAINIKKLLILDESGRMKEKRAEIEATGLFDTVDNTVGLPQEFMSEVVIKGVSKATGMAHLLEYLGHDRAFSVAFGDGANDIEMVEFAALGIAMGNASEDLKERADYITADIESDGLAKGISYALSLLS